MLYFFLSYARGGDDIYVRQFFNDLCEEIRVLEGLDSDAEVGFIDYQGIRPGNRWPDRLHDALSECRTFLALCSPAYFLSEACGEEWAIFADRVNRHHLRTGVGNSTLIPLRWVPSRTLPAAAQTVQYMSEPFQGDSRRERGIRQLLRLQRNRDDYLAFVTDVAECVVEALQAGLPPAAERRRLPSAFHTRTTPNSHAAGLVLDPGRTAAMLPLSSQVYFVMSAPTLEESADASLGRDERMFYGEQAGDWSPYRPATDEALARFATRIAHGRELKAEVMEVGELADCIEQARRNNQIVVLLVDPWSTRMERHSRILRDYDQRDEQEAAVMIPWSRDDAETQAKSEELLESVRRTFPRNAARPHTATYRPAVLSSDTFGEELQLVLTECRSRAIANGSLRRPTPDSAGSRPILDG
ncbi:TIR-like protein FxsC [Actinoplanes sp. NPDC020271]|uniref:TIR-like protein FxsC n=1 Tax=Actinoplanes sp. NPDC020271 TaxID=3363896 RepID=UPI0037B05BA6